MSPLHLTIAIQLVLLPLLLLAWQLLGGEASRALWLLKTVAIGAALAALALVAPWQLLSAWLRFVYLGLYLVTVVVSAIRVWPAAAWAPPVGRGWIAGTAAVVVLVAGALLLTSAVRAMQPPAGTLALASPLRGDLYYVGHGGSHPLLNGHMKVAAPALHDWRGQLWGLDIVKLHLSGNRARGLYPRRLSDYAIFGEPVLAPCAGTVVATENTLPDLIPPATDTIDKAGNHVLLECDGGGAVLLAHLRQGSVQVGVGARVDTGQPLGEVGNSGNTSEPHLHISAQAGPGGATILDADPLALTLDGRFPVRNGILRPRGE